MLYGALVEAFITFISRFVALESANWTSSSAAVINAITTVALCIFGKCKQPAVTVTIASANAKG